MSYEYLVMTKEELIEAFGEPIDTSVDPKQLLAEGYGVYDEDGKDTTNVNYGADMSDENNPNYGNRGHLVHTEETKKHLSKVITGSHPDQSYRTPEHNKAHSVFMTGEGNSNWKGGITKGPNYERDKMRRWRAKQAELYGPDWRKTA